MPWPKGCLVLCATAFLVVPAMAGCGPSTQELAATAGILTAAAATDTPTPLPPTATSTPIPYDLSVLVVGEDGEPIHGAIVAVAQIGGDGSEQETGEAGEASWYDLPSEEVALSVGAQGYFAVDQSESLARGANQLMVALERDPSGILPSEACGPGESLLYVEDFQDGAAQEWHEVEFRTQGWNLGPDPESPEDLAIWKMADFEGSTGYGGRFFDNAVLRVRFMPVGTPVYNLAWHWNPGGYEVEGTRVEWSSYNVWFHPPGATRTSRSQPPVASPLIHQAFSAPSPGTWHLFEMSTHEGTVELWIDGVRLFQYEDPHPLPEGTIILGVGMVADPGNQGVVYFDDIAVCELTAPFQPLVSPPG